MKQNKDGRPCPEWCGTDHQADEWESCRGPRHDLRVKNDLRGSVSAGFSPFDERPELTAYLWGKDIGDPGGNAHAKSGWQAESLAKFVERASELTPAQGKSMAASIREAAAEAFPEQEAEAG